MYRWGGVVDCRGGEGGVVEGEMQFLYRRRRMCCGGGKGGNCFYGSMHNVVGSISMNLVQYLVRMRN